MGLGYCKVPDLVTLGRSGKGREIPARSNVVLLTGGLGGARLAPALRDELGSGNLTVVVNTGDDLQWHGVRVCPDLDSVTYSLAGTWDHERGWGLKNETFCVRDAILGLGASAWFNVGDKDLAYHLMRGDLLRDGHSLSDATRRLSEKLGISGVDILPASDDPNETHVLLEDGRLLHFQEWYVGERAKPELKEVRLARGDASGAAIEAISRADALIIGPSNPVTSIGAILALKGMEEVARKVPKRISVSPIVLGVPSEDAGIRHHSLARQRVMQTIGRTDEPSDAASLRSGLSEVFVLDHSDEKYEKEIRHAGLQSVMADLLNPVSLAGTLADLTR